MALFMPSTPQPRRLTKSRFKLGLQCPTKLYYADKPEYANTQCDDSFLQALAAGGYQVGELAKLYYPEGTDITTLDSTAALKQTESLLEAENTTLFEAAISVDNLLARVDILQKSGNHLNLIEVKAKSVDPANPCLMRNNGSGPTSAWNAYLQDVAFQCHILEKSYPDYTISCHLMLVDKTAVAGSDGLNARFRIVRHHGTRQSIEVDPGLTDTDLEPRLLTLINVDEAVSWIRDHQNIDGDSFPNRIVRLANAYTGDERIQGATGKHCLTCEFKNKVQGTPSRLKSGYEECWRQEHNWTDADFQKPTVLNIWNLRTANQLMQKGILHLDSLSEEDIKVTSDDAPGLSQTQRQWMQIDKARTADSEPYIDKNGLAAEMQSWQYPLHMIDFETTAPALPFTRGLKPYEIVAFQFSHHVLYDDGTVEHRGQFLESTPGTFPNLAFVRELKRQLSGDTGSVFRFHNHENTVLVNILQQLEAYELTDSNETSELISFIKNLTHAPANFKNPWSGQRDMIDLHKLNLRYYYDPATGGSNSLKALLPALLSSSSLLRNKYSAPIYGAADGIPSLNFRDHQWVTANGGNVKDPYSLLPDLFDDEDSGDSLISGTDRIADGGAAMTAYAYLQYLDMGDRERNAMNDALLKYCELDTMAMIMVIEAWRDMIDYPTTRIPKSA